MVYNICFYNIIKLMKCSGVIDLHHIKHILLITLIAIFIASGISGVSFYISEINIIISGLLGFAFFWFAFLLMTAIYISRYRKENATYIYRKKVIKKARLKLLKVRYYQMQVRSMEDFKNIHKVYKAANQIIKVVREDPTRYQSSKRFFTDYVDSISVLVEKYVLFVKHPVKNKEIMKTLKETKLAIEEMTHKLENELITILSKDQMNLDLELDYVRQSMQEEFKN